MNTTAFYDGFFRRGSFLDHDAESVYARPDYLWSLGFADLDWRDKTVLELGAGKGRLTRSLPTLEAGRYIVVEPSRGLEEIPTTPNMARVNDTLANLHRYVAPGSVDYFIASGVIPHLPGDLPTIVRQIEPFLSETGVLHVHSSFYGYPKTIGRRLQGWGRPAAVVATALQETSPRPWFLKNCFHSFQPTLKGRYLFHREVVTARPYNIHWGYADHFTAVEAAGLSVTRLFPHSIAFTAARQGAALSSPTLPVGRIAVLGTDWAAQWVRETLAPKADLIPCPERGYDAVVIGYDYTVGGAYYTAVEACEREGYRLGESLFLFQMLC